MHPEYKALNRDYYPILSALIVRDGYRCACCGDAKHAIIIDHIISIHRGGKTEIENLQLLCKSCNGHKEAETYDFRPANRGRLGEELPRFTDEGALIIRISRYGWRIKRFEDAEIIDVKSTRVHVRFLADGRVVTHDLRAIYPPDLQHLF